MNTFALAAIAAFIVIALFAKHRKSNGGRGGGGLGGGIRGGSNVYRGPKHGAFKEYVRDREKDRQEHFSGNQSGEHASGAGRNVLPIDFDDVKYREESVPFNQFNATSVAQSKSQILDEKLSADPNGVFGEAAVSAIVARVAHDDGHRHCLLQNVYIQTHAGYTEIDTVLLHESGVYVFETKNVSGEVSGDLEQERWNLYLNERTQHTLYNPLKQNQGHIGALLRQLRTSYSRARVYSFVVFSDRCVLKHVPGSGNRFQVLHFGELKLALSKVLKLGTSVHNKKQLDNWVSALQPCVNVSESVKQAHRASVQKIHC